MLSDLGPRLRPRLRELLHESRQLSPVDEQPALAYPDSSQVALVYPLPQGLGTNVELQGNLE
jgi:hypothetical protein